MQILSGVEKLTKSIIIYGQQDERRHREERERKKAEVRARLEAQASKKSKKKGFMTPERKKKLRILLRRKAAEELKRQQEAKANERRKVIAERAGTRENFDLMSESELRSCCKQFHERIKSLESSKWDLEYAVGRKELEVSERLIIMISQLSQSIDLTFNRLYRPKRFMNFHRR